MLVLKNIEKVLTELTGDPRPEIALRLTLQDAIENRLNKIIQSIKNFEIKFGMNFSEFKIMWDRDKICNKYSYEIEKDYWEWEGLISRKRKLEKIKECLI